MRKGNEYAPQKFLQGTPGRTRDAGRGRRRLYRPSQRAAAADDQGREGHRHSGGRNYRWLFLKIVTSEAGLYGIGSANDNYQTFAVAAALEKHLKPWLIGKDPDRIEDLWQSANFRTYWRGGPVNNKVVAAMDEALWDIKGKRAGMPVYELLGGRAHDAVACYDHVSGRTKEQAAEAVARVDGERLPAHPRAVRRRRLLCLSQILFAAGRLTCKQMFDHDIRQRQMDKHQYPP